MNWKKIVGWALVIPMGLALIFMLIVGVVGWLSFFSKLANGDRGAIISAAITAGCLVAVALGRLGIKLLEK